MHVDDVCDVGGDRAAIAAPPRKLETHVWHAKRFEMRRHEAHGYALAWGRRGKGRGWRSTMRFASERCVAHDASYHSTLVLRGTETDIMKTLRDVAEGGDAKAVGSVAARRGDVAADVTLARRDGRRKGNARVIAPAMALWEPTDATDTDTDAAAAALLRRELTLWVHPGAAEEARDALATAASDRGVDVEATRVRGGCRVELVGETAAAVLASVLDEDEGGVTRGGGQTAAAWLRDARGAPRGVLRAATRGDPREAAWAAKKKSGDDGGEDAASIVGRGVARGDDDVRAAGLAAGGGAGARSTRSTPPPPATAQALASRRARIRADRVAGRARASSPAASPSPSCPVLIVRRASHPRLPIARRGFTIIAPSGWALPLWLALVHLGARAAGQREWGWLASAAGAATFPDDFPDAAAGATAIESARASMDARAAKTPRGKRGAASASALGALEVVKRGGARVARTKKAVAAAAAAAGTTTTYVRALVRCPWGGRPVPGAPVLMPRQEEIETWSPLARRARERRGKGERRGRLSSAVDADVDADVDVDVDARVVIGVVTSASSSAASLGVASALVDARALARATRGGGDRDDAGGSKPGRGGGGGGGGGRDRFVALLVPGARPAAIVPAVASVALDASDVDAVWW